MAVAAELAVAAGEQPPPETGVDREDPEKPSSAAIRKVVVYSLDPFCSNRNHPDLG